MANSIHSFYPSFGVPIGNQEINFSSLAKKTSTIALSILIGAGIGIAVGGPFGAVIGASLVGGIILVCILVDHVRSRVFAYRLQPALLSQTIVNSNAPVLGASSKANVRVINDSKESFKWKKKLISIAKTSIELSPNFAGGKDFQKVLDIIETRMSKKPKLRTHLLLSKDLLEKADILRLQRLAEKFGDRFIYLITDRIYHTLPFLHSEENHVKALIVDGKYFVIGGTGIHHKMSREIYQPTEEENKENFASKFIDKGFRDTDLVGEGSAVLTMREQFFSLFQKWEKRMCDCDKNRFFSIKNASQGISKSFNQKKGLIKNVSIKLFVGGPEHVKNNPITGRIVKRIQKATGEIRLGSLLFNPDKTVKQTLLAKKNQSIQPIKIVGYFNGTGKNSSISHYMYALPNRFNYGLFTKIYEYKKPNQLYHKKVATFDKRYTIIGSYNLGQKSAICDDEIIVEIKSKRVAEQINKGLKEDAKRSKRLEGTKELQKLFYKIVGAPIIESLGTFFG